MQEHEDLERELKELMRMEESGEGKGVDRKAAKARMRVLKNRLAAQRSREQAREYVQKLENTVQVLSNKSENLARRLAALEAENRLLKASMGVSVKEEMNNAEGCIGESAVLPINTSQQLDAAQALTLLLTWLLSTLLPLDVALDPKPPQNPPAQPSMLPLPSTQAIRRPGCSRSMRSLRLAGQLRCISGGGKPPATLQIPRPLVCL